MSKYFQGVEFPELETPPAAAAPLTADEAKAKDEMVEFHRIVMRMLDSVRSGESQLAPGLQLRGSGLLNAIERMRSSPTRENVLEFLSVARQDVNHRFAQECERTLQSESAFVHGAKKQDQKYQFPYLRRAVVGT